MCTCRYDGSSWDGTGPNLVTRVVKDFWCGNTTKFTSGSICKGVQLLPPAAFYAIPWTQHASLFNDEPESLKHVLRQTNNSYLVHFWNKLSEGSAAKWKSDTQPFAVLASRFCPVTSEYAKTMWNTWMHQAFVSMLFSYTCKKVWFALVYGTLLLGISLML